MRTPTLLFVAGVLTFFVASLLFPPQSVHSIHQRQDAYADSITTALAGIVAVGSTGATDSLAVGFVNQVRVHPGIRLRHVPGLGRQLRLTGPRELIEALREPASRQVLVLDFTRPIRTDRYLTVELDLSSLGSDAVGVELELPHPGRSQFPPRFETAAPLRIPELTLRGVQGTEAVRIETDRLIVGSDTDLGLLRGTTRILRQTVKGETQPVPPGLRITGQRLTYR